MKMIKIWIVFVGIYMILGGLIHMPIAYDITSIPGWKAKAQSVEALLGYYSNTYLGITFLVIGIFLFFTYKDPSKYILFILLNIVIHSYVYIFNMMSVQIGLAGDFVMYLAQIHLLIVLTGGFGYFQLTRMKQTLSTS